MKMAYLFSVYDVRKAVSPHGNVTCAKPAIDEGIFRRLWVSVIPVCNDGTFDEDFAWLPLGDVVEVFVYESEVCFSKAEKE